MKKANNQIISVPVNQPLLDGNEKKYLLECIKTGWISSEGPFVKEFENKFASRMGRKFGVAVSSGSAALEIAVAALGIGKGDEVIMPTFTIISCVAPIIRAGARPVLVDSDPRTWNMDVTQIEKKITPQTKAIMVVHIYGLPADIEPILNLAAKHGLKVIEDAAEMHGQTYKDNPCGSFGDISIFSFYPNKLITTGEGGMVLTNDKLLAEKSREFRNLCFQVKKRFVHEKFGWNFRMTNLQAALGLAQLERLDEFVKRKRAMGRLYSKLLQGVDNIELPLERTNYAENIYWVFGIVLADKVNFEADETMRRLGKLGIETRPFFWPIHEQPVLQKKGFFRNERYPVAERLARRGFYLPSGLALTQKQIKHAAFSLRSLIQ